MKFNDAAKVLDGIPHISRHSARVLYDFIRAEKPVDCLELGFAHGASSGYVAAALAANGQGHLTSVDLEASREFHTTIEQTLASLNLASMVTVCRELNSYNWFLKKQIEAQTTDDVCAPCYDFVFIDGSKNWTIDGLAFFLADKLLRPGGWILFDDYSWRYADAIERGKTQSDGVSARDLSPDQIDEPNVAAIFHLLVAQHPDYSRFQVQDDSWAWARKAPGTREVKKTGKSVLGSRLSRWKARVSGNA
ncbi:class I SAM-dependent methyltransferase [Salinisphaera sp. T31B1]|uniref:class I SAM-dependent methyltransferase n=1 Tax=Salinisphaera sp. T31B1 TaxID=727963 RepID=UPI00333E903B